MATDQGVPPTQRQGTVSATASNPPAVSLPRHYWSWSTSLDNELQELQVLVIDYDAKKVLLRLEGQHWILPGRLIPYNSFPLSDNPISIIPIVHDIIGTALPLAFLRQFWTQRKEVKIEGARDKLEKSVISMELIGAATAVEHGYCWKPMKEANVFHFFDDAAKAVRVEVEWALKGSQPRNRFAWQRPGWFSTTASWMEDVIHHHCGASLTEAILCLRSSALGVILRAKTAKGQFFLKCTPPVANDAAYTQVLARIVPHYVAKPVAVNAGKQIMVTADYGEILESFRFSKHEEMHFSRDYACLQKATIDRTDELIRAGCPDLRPSKLLEQIDKLPFNDMFRALGNSEESTGDVLFYCENRHAFKEKLKKLIDSKIPPTITHNDLGFTNMYRPADSAHYMFFDWVDAFVAHPFTSFMDGIDELSFLQEWTAYGSLDQLKEWQSAGEIFRELAMLILRLQEASARERMDAEVSLDSARRLLWAFNYSFREQ